jgi:DNA-3-methyladenine glycosylase
VTPPRSAARPARRSSFGAPLPPSFYDRPTELVARDLLGRVLQHRSAEGSASGRIVEVEAYLGPHDPACHAAAGLTGRTEHLHGPPGRAYVYFVYGVHWCVNAVTRERGHGSAVLIRALEPLDGLALMRERRGVASDVMLTNGPGKLCQALGIDGAHNGLPLCRGTLRILEGSPLVDEAAVGTSPRIGITRAVDWPLRFYARGNPFVSPVRAGVPARSRARPARRPTPR